MVYVQLAQDWTDDTGTAHHSGDMVDVDPVTLANLEAAGIVWRGPTGDDGQPNASTLKTTDWRGPTTEPVK
jgi:hypothetical protein